MGWANCGTDKDGRPIGYAHEATCDHPECKAKIDRGLSYVCGTMHGDEQYGCGKYFCAKHLTYVEFKDGTLSQCCKECYDLFEANGDLSDDGPLSLT